MTSITLPDLDGTIIYWCDLFQDYRYINRINRHYHKVITRNQLYQQWYRTYTELIKHPTRDDLDVDDVFRYACHTGCLDLAMYMFGRYNNNIYFSARGNLRLALKHNRLDVARWLYETAKQTGKRLSAALYYICCNGTLEAVKWLVGWEDHDIVKVQYYEMFTVSCLCGKLDMMQWLYENMSTYDLQLIDWHMFQLSCTGGSIEAVKWMYQMCSQISVPQYDILIGAHKRAYQSTSLEVVVWLDQLCLVMLGTNDFRDGYVAENLDIAKWLYEKHKCSIPATLFRRACQSGNVELAQWLFEFSPTKFTSDEFHKLVLSAGMYRHLPIVQWLWDVGVSMGISVDIHYRNDQLFRAWCAHGALDVVQWLWQLRGKRPGWRKLFGMKAHKPINIHARSDSAFWCSCTNGHLDLSKWLYGLSIELGSPICITGDLIEKWESDSPRMTRWLKKLM